LLLRRGDGSVVATFGVGNTPPSKVARAAEQDFRAKGEGGRAEAGPDDQATVAWLEEASRLRPRLGKPELWAYLLFEMEQMDLAAGHQVCCPRRRAQSGHQCCSMLDTDNIDL
jgi:hypothetical protein